MGRRPRSTEVAVLCRRLDALCGATSMSNAHISRHLGHSNGSTLSVARGGRAFLDSASLSRLGSLLVRKSAAPNLHWLLTGTGRPFLGVGDPRSAVADALSTLVEAELTTAEHS